MLRKKIINFVLVCLTAGPLMAQDSKLMSKDLREFSGNEALMIRHKAQKNDRSQFETERNCAFPAWFS